MKANDRVIAMLTLACLGFIFVSARWGYGAVFSSGKTSFSVRCNELLFGYQIQSLFLLPGEKVQIQVVDANWHQLYDLEAQSGKVQSVTNRYWIWEAPAKPGVGQVVVTQRKTGQAMQINLIVMMPYAQLHQQEINGYRIGRYPAPRVVRDIPYTPPSGFVEVTPENFNLPVSPHFTLGQFVCKQAADFPKYVVLDERLLLKLEVLLEKLEQEGYPGASFHVLSGFRTPYYNRSLGNVAYSSHVWGQAVDIFIDQDQDGMMDDLNHDGRIDQQDAAVLYRLIDHIDGDYRYHDLVGGLGLYEKNEAHGPFVHLDVRGARARWGIRPQPSLAGRPGVKDSM